MSPLAHPITLFKNFAVPENGSFEFLTSISLAGIRLQQANKINTVEDIAGQSNALVKDRNNFLYTPLRHTGS